MPRISKGLIQAYQLQDFTFEAAMSLKDSLPRKEGKMTITREDAQSIAALVKSWESCQQRIQVHRRVPNPGSLKHAVAKSKLKRRLQPVSPIEFLDSTLSQTSDGVVKTIKTTPE